MRPGMDLVVNLNGRLFLLSGFGHLQIPYRITG
jgi:hypothetical protein